MVVVTATARQPLPTTPDPTRATKVLDVVTTYLEGNQLLVHNVKSATMVHNAPPPPLRPGDLPMNPVNTAIYLGVEQAAISGGVTLPTKPDTAADTDTGHSTHHGTLHPGPGILSTCRAQRSYRIPGLAPNTLPAHAASRRYHSATSVDHPPPPAHIATCSSTRGITTVLRRQNRSPRQQRVHSSHYGPHNHEPEVREVFTLTLRGAQYHRNTCPKYILHQRGLPTKVGTRLWNHLQLLLPHQQHVIQTNHRCREAGPLAVLHTDVGGGPTGSATILDLVGTTLQLARVTPNQMQALQRVGTHHVPFLQHLEWHKKSLLENHMRSAATQTGHPQPTDGEVREPYNLFWNTHKQPLPPSPPRGNQAHHRAPEQVEYVPSATVSAVLLLAPNWLEATLRPGRARGNLWMLPPATARPFCRPPLSQDKLTGTPTTC